ncbi:hypothetical protein E1A91_D02G085400v1 [Gossypium mustelinum]|uniref:Uncharacterized protein n=1 Tax=Gossypium mustelinum TaxID=34275 RepID=A0A5D2VU14_GOSMU|nr:hypothetical protein E1A91_D02G085400v1 [Gossypium mustelinum]
MCRKRREKKKSKAKKRSQTLMANRPMVEKKRGEAHLKKSFFCYIYLKKTIINIYFPIEVIMENMISLGSENQEGFLLFFYKENPEGFLHEQLRVFFPHNFKVEIFCIVIFWYDIR